MMGRKSLMFDFVSTSWNPLIGCCHNCTYCYARPLAQRLYPKEGFRLRLIPGRLKFRKRNQCVFVVSMGDLFCAEVPNVWIREVLRAARNAPKSNTFLFLTKNPWRYFDFLEEFPSNALFGVTIETNRSELTQQLSRAPAPLDRFYAMNSLRAYERRTFVVIEPVLDFRPRGLKSWLEVISPEFVVIGYDNHRHRLPEPALEKTREFIEALEDAGLEVLKKTLRPAWWE